MIQLQGFQEKKIKMNLQLLKLVMSIIYLLLNDFFEIIFINHNLNGLSCDFSNSNFFYLNKILCNFVYLYLLQQYFSLLLKNSFCPLFYFFFLLIKPSFQPRPRCYRIENLFFIVLFYMGDIFIIFYLCPMVKVQSFQI